MPNKIKEYRKLRNFSQGRLAERAGIVQQNLSDIERGAGNPTIETVSKIAAALGVTIGELYGSTVPAAEVVTPKATGITDEDIRMLIELRTHNIETVSDLKAMIQRDELLKKAFTPAPRNPLYTEQEQEYYLDRPEHKTKSAIKKQKKQEHHKS